ncbi:2-hydroxy-6-oxonona-2,4-dienedioate hydrolase/2-succinyl-6-hydroxy-2,4-cyclohexadiene-1-carboxylate synthase [Singulisphaera sp. GP187]|uniref:alpha/beta fold hydrolase n=1 Tax=Singulisphaera sp. GP187 TaxID=1882752 RepID=UPI0009289162|nr:alpha/beta hydrolase [Singulisphaera sp. GP187]SIN90048.1 2-hydroxy-6-oxonona-2,4-dienedioate hydrolase/2-succinyl-6-hydroxy-2,4-cyclohexadiene-1-carboxylate synthase [Singulisphaera sp. GP187]
MPFSTLSGLRFHYQQAGEGPDVVLIHGVTGDLSIWYLCQAIQTLSAARRVTAYDLRGHGYTDAPPRDYTSADHAADLFALMDDRGIERATLVGHSFGGVIALHAAVIAPERVDAMVLSDPYFPALRHLEDVSRWGHWQSFCDEARRAGVELSDEHWYDLGRFFDQIVDLEGDRLLQFRREVGLPALNRLLRLGGTTCGDDTKVEAGLTADLIASVAVPSLALYGEFSPFLATAQYLVEHLPNCRSEIVPAAKHRAPEENPTAFLSLLRGFIETLPGASSSSGPDGSVSESSQPTCGTR